MNTVPPDNLLATTLRAIGDAVIFCDRESRVSMMNAVAEQLTGWSEPEALGRLLGDVFVLVEEGTRRPVEDPAGRVLRQGRVAGLANHTLLLRRDGTEVPIDDSAAPVRDAAGAMRGVVLVFRDVSERRRAEWNLQMLAESGRALADAREVRSLLQEVSEAASRHFADVCLFDLGTVGSALEREVGRHRDPARQELADGLMQFRPEARATEGDEPARATHPVLEVMATGKPVLTARVSDEFLAGVAVSAEHLRYMREELRPLSLLPCRCARMTA